MATINSNWVSDYFKVRPQLKRPKCSFGMYEIQPEWKPVVDSLLAIVEPKITPFKPQCFGELFDKLPIADCEGCPVYDQCEIESLTETE